MIGKTGEKMGDKLPWWVIPGLMIASVVEGVKEWFYSFKKKKTPDEIYRENLYPPKDPNRGPFTP
jgi:hypothetical protein